MRDYGDPPPLGTVEVRPYSERTWDGRSYELRQVWRWHGPGYDMSLEMIPLASQSGPARAVSTSYLAIAPAHVQRLVREAGFEFVQRVDERFFQPVVVARKPPVT